MRASAPTSLDFSVGDEVNEIRTDVYAGERIAGSPIESFTLSGTQQSFTWAQMRTGRYYILVSIKWSRLTDRGGTGRAFLVEIVAP